MAYISKQIQYPDEAKRNRVQGLAKVEGIIERDGTISNPKLLRDPGSGLGEEALRLIGQMKDSVGLWTPGEVGGIAVRTRIELPIIFQLKRDDIAPLVVITDSDKNVLHDCIRVADISVLEGIDGVAIKELSSKKSRLDYGEKGRYGVYQVKLPKGKGRLPSALRKQEEVEAFEMYFDGLVLDTDQRKLIYSFNDLSSDANIVVYNVGGRTIAESWVTTEDQLEGEIDLSSTRSKLFFVSIIQKDLVHTRVIKL